MSSIYYPQYDENVDDYDVHQQYVQNILEETAMEEFKLGSTVEELYVIRYANEVCINVKVQSD